MIDISIKLKLVCQIAEIWQGLVQYITVVLNISDMYTKHAKKLYMRT